MRIFEKILGFLSVAFVALHGSTTLVDSRQEDVASGTSVAANQLHLGQDGGGEFINFRIHLGEKDDLIYPSLLWHYRMGVRHFEIVNHGLTANQSKKIGMFFDRVKDICTLNLIETPGADRDMSAVSTTSTTSPDLKWYLELTDRQFLCLRRPLEEILVENSASTLLFPSSTYSGFDPDAPVSFWPQTDEQLIYRGPITHDAPFTLTNLLSGGSAKQSSAAYIANYAPIETAVPFAADMIKDQLPVVKVLTDFVLFSMRSNSIKYSTLTKTGDIWFGHSLKFYAVAKAGTSTIREMMASSEFQRKINLESLDSKYDIMEAMRFQYSENIPKTFICGRNPYNRALSMFLYLKPQHDFLNKALAMETYCEFNDFEFFLQMIKRYLKKNGPHGLDVHLCPQVTTSANLLAQSFDHIIHLENFRDEAVWLIKYLNLPGGPNDYFEGYHATNASLKLSQYYTQECVQLVLEIYGSEVFGDDFNFFGYDKTPHFSLKM